jgi:hypothetical protein
MERNCILDTENFPACSPILSSTDVDAHTLLVVKEKIPYAFGVREKECLHEFDLLAEIQFGGVQKCAKIRTRYLEVVTITKMGPCQNREVPRTGTISNFYRCLHVHIKVRMLISLATHD